MDNSVENYWKIRLENCKAALEKNNFEAFIADDPQEAKAIVLSVILPNISVKTASWGDSMTLCSTGILDAMRQRSDVRFIETFDKTVSRDEVMERRRQALLSDIFFTGTNALTQGGVLVNLDMVGNRVAGITFGPRHVVITVGRNKIVANPDEAMKRIRNFAAPANAIRHHVKTPCVKTSRCMDCKSQERICNTWTITEKSFPKGRIKVILINKELGL